MGLPFFWGQSTLLSWVNSVCTNVWLRFFYIHLASLQCSAEELEHDMREVLNQVLRDSEFSDLILLMRSDSYNDITGDVHKAVVEAFDCLHDPHAEANIHQNVSISALLVISAVAQLLVCLLCKRVMQLMSSNSLCVYHHKIPTSYTQSYLNYQNHFNLKRLIESHLQFIKSPMWV